MEFVPCPRCGDDFETETDLCGSCQLCHSCCCQTLTATHWDQLACEFQLAVAMSAYETWRLGLIDAPPWHALPAAEHSRWVEIVETVHDVQTEQAPEKETS